MPLLAINLSDTLSDQIKVLVEKGLYRSFEAFLEIAAFNQLALERGATLAEIVERGHRQPRRGGHAAAVNGSARAESKAQPADVAVKTARGSPPRRAVEPVARMAPPDDTTVTEEVFNATFKRLALLPRTEASPQPCEPSPNGLSSERVFGQVNRLLPLKLACRWLASPPSLRANGPATISSATGWPTTPRRSARCSRSGTRRTNGSGTSCSQPAYPPRQQRLTR